MSQTAIEVKRPDRWQHPLDPEMAPEAVAWLLTQMPFAHMDNERFSSTARLTDILRNDTRLMQLRSGDVIFREGQYGGSAYLVLDGQVRIFLDKLLSADPPKRKRLQSGWLGLTQLWNRRAGTKSDRRKRSRQAVRKVAAAPVVGNRGTGKDTRIFIQDVAGVLEENATTVVRAGELFGEMAAVTRSPREFTALAESDCVVLEVRWQGLKLLKQDPAFRRLLDERYAREMLRTHLCETELFRYVPDESWDHIIGQAKIEQFGELEWYAKYRKQSQEEVAKRIGQEPLIAQEGMYATGLWIVRGGFARLSRRQGAGHRTLAYLGKGQIFGLREIAHNYQLPKGEAPLPYQESLRAVGYVDAICLPKAVVMQHVLPYQRAGALPQAINNPRYRLGQPVVDAPLETTEHNMETGLLEFLVDERLMNGRQTMIIDLERCTRCDDCVRACATTHGGTPVFSREGPQYGSWMFAHACMHCVDPVCMIGCPTGAIHRDHESGLVRISESSCIGCKGCAESCPYDNIRMVSKLDGSGRAQVEQSTGLPILQASKCDMCESTGGRPACKAACPHDALVRMDMGNLLGLSDFVNRHKAT